MSKFNVGDKVKLNDFGYQVFFSELDKGVEGVVTKHDRYTMVRLVTKFGRTEEFFPFREEEIDLVSQLSVGDWVEVKGWSKSFDGIGQVTRTVERAHDVTFTVEFPGRTGDFECGTFTEKYLTLTEEPKPVTPDYSDLLDSYVGDWPAMLALPVGVVLMSTHNNTLIRKVADAEFTSFTSGLPRSGSARITVRSEGYLVFGVPTA